MKIMLNCKETSTLITKETEGTISLSEGMQLRMHVMMCKFCKLFRKQSKFISDSAHHLGDHTDESLPDQGIKEGRKAIIQRAIQQEMSKDS